MPTFPCFFILARWDLTNLVHSSSVLYAGSAERESNMRKACSPIASAAPDMTTLRAARSDVLSTWYLSVVSPLEARSTCQRRLLAPVLGRMRDLAELVGHLQSELGCRLLHRCISDQFCKHPPISSDKRSTFQRLVDR